jgi:hypothetical protein
MSNISVFTGISIDERRSTSTKADHAQIAGLVHHGNARAAAATNILPAGLPETAFHAPRLAARSGSLADLPTWNASDQQAI